MFEFIGNIVYTQDFYTVKLGFVEH